MDIINARWADADQSAVLASVDGAEMTIPATAENRHYAALVALDITPAPYVPPEAPSPVSPTREELLQRIEVLAAQVASLPG
jgi:hypothetical protein